MKCFVTFRLKPGVTPSEYEEWFRRENVPAVRKMTSISSYRVWRAVDVADGSLPFDFIEEMELADREAFDREVEELPEMAAMLEAWYARVADQAIMYAVEVAQENDGVT
jgi:REDY-like protein HapK